MLKIYINSIEVLVKPNTTVLEACETIGIEIPRFCYHERLSIAGNCRMCLVEIEKSPKPVVSCAMPIMNGMKIFTDTPLVKKSREAVLEFLLLNHPLDCPICDQGGECDLQDQTIMFGSDRSRFYDFKRGVEDKNLGPLIKTIMTRCIHCTRCVRFSIEIAGVEDLGTTARGTHTEIGTYIEKVFQSELSGNVIDLCPVGALTSKPYAFTSRPWELKTVETIDASDAIGSNIRVDFKENEIMRILPRLNEDINEEWISNKTRFSYDGIKNQRLLTPSIKGVPYDWEDSLYKIMKSFKNRGGNDIVGICHSSTDLETQVSFKDFINSLGSESVGFINKLGINTDFPTAYRLNSSIASIANSDLCLLVGVDPRYEGSLLNVRLRKRFFEGGFSVSSVGSALNLTYPVDHLGLGGGTLTQISKGKHKFCSKLKEAKNPIIILGSGVLKRDDSLNIQHMLNNIGKQSATASTVNSSLGILHTQANQVGSLDLGLCSITLEQISKAKVLYLVGVDDQDINKISKHISSDCFVIYQGTHKISSTKVDVFLPTLTFTEKVGTFVNTEGRPQKALKVLKGPGLAKEDWQIFRALSEIVNDSLNYTHLDHLGTRLLSVLPILSSIGHIEDTLVRFKDKVSHSNILFTKFNPLIKDFYLTDSITRASRIMAECSVSLRKESKPF